MRTSFAVSLIFTSFIGFQQFSASGQSVQTDFNKKAKSAKKSVYKNALIIGNSLTRHGLAPFWWGNWGMAASSPDKDFVHVLVSLLRQQNETMDFSTLQASGWERNHQNFDLNQYDSVFYKKPDLIILRLGENVKDLAYYEQSCMKFLNYIREKSPDAFVVTTGNFWSNQAKDVAMKNAAQTTGTLFIPLSDLDTKENKSSIGAIVGGEDGVEHKIDHNGVANHPGDEGMKHIAYRIFENLP